MADTLRGLVRCAFPLGCLLVLAGLLYSGQGRDVLRALVGAVNDPLQGNAVAGLVFLWTASALLSMSVWYSMRWLLAAPMPGLPLPLQAGRAQKWVPRLAGATAPGLIATALWALRGAEAPAHPQAAAAATQAMLWFIGQALLLLLGYSWRGELLLRLRRSDWLSSVQGRAGSQPAVLADDQTLAPLTQRVIVWSLLLTLALALLFFLFPVTLPRVVGAAAVAALALASINLFGSFVLTWWPLRRGLPPLAPVLLLVAGLVFSAFNDNHGVPRALPNPAAAVPAASANSSIPSTSTSTSGAEAVARLGADAGLPDFLAAAPARDPQGRVLLLVVAAEGGGIRAAYWTAAVLEALAQRQPLFEQQLFALSGVSGGSLGLAAWLAHRRSHWCAEPAAAAGAAVRWSTQVPSARTALGADFMAPALAALLYGDLMQRFVPLPVAALDRGRVIEAAWQRAFAHLPGQPFAHSLQALYQGCPRPLPHLLLNATRVETGQRVVLSRLPAALFANTFDAMPPGSPLAHQSLAGLVHHSARFPLISPAATVELERAAEAASTASAASVSATALAASAPAAGPTQAGAPRAFRLVDGGYFDNSGVATAVDLLQSLPSLRSLSARPTGAVGTLPAAPAIHPILLLVRNEATPLATQAPYGDPPATGFPELGSIVRTLLNARGAHAVGARAAALRVLPADDIIDLVVPAQTPAAQAPLGWALSAQVRQALDVAAAEVAACAARALADRAAGRVPSCGVAAERGSSP